jgi:hypothetical protein
MPFAFEIACSLEFSKGNAEFEGVLVSTLGFFLRVQRGQIWGLFWGSKGCIWGFF